MLIEYIADITKLIQELGNVIEATTILVSVAYGLKVTTSSGSGSTKRKSRRGRANA